MEISCSLPSRIPTTVLIKTLPRQCCHRWHLRHYHRRLTAQPDQLSRPMLGSPLTASPITFLLTTSIPSCHRINMTCGKKYFLGIFLEGKKTLSGENVTCGALFSAQFLCENSFALGEGKKYFILLEDISDSRSFSPDFSRSRNVICFLLVPCGATKIFKI